MRRYLAPPKQNKWIFVLAWQYSNKIAIFIDPVLFNTVAEGRHLNECVFVLVCCTCFQWIRLYKVTVDLVSQVIFNMHKLDVLFFEKVLY